MRPIEVTMTKKCRDGFEEFKEIGEFHTWGYSFEEFPDCTVQVSVGIVEFTDGTVKTVSPESIKFIDGPMVGAL